jgi:hypothetical protein
VVLAVVEQVETMVELFFRRVLTEPQTLVEVVAEMVTPHSPYGVALAVVV